MLFMFMMILMIAMAVMPMTNKDYMTHTGLSWWRRPPVSWPPRAEPRSGTKSNLFPGAACQNIGNIGKILDFRDKKRESDDQKLSHRVKTITRRICLADKSSIGNVKCQPRSTQENFTRKPSDTSFVERILPARIFLKTIRFSRCIPTRPPEFP